LESTAHREVSASILFGVPFPHAIALILAALPFPRATPGQSPGERIASEIATRARARAAEASAALTAVEVELARTWLARRPSLARQRGLPPLDLAELRLGAAARRAWERALGDVQADLERVDWVALEPARRADRAWFAAFVGAELGAQQRRAAERWDPGFYLREIADVLAGLSRAAELTPDVRVQATTAHLARVPALLAAARGDIGTPPEVAARRALRFADELETHLDGALAERLARGEPSPGLWRGYQAARDGARAATVDFRAWLAEAALRREPLTPLGPGAWAALVKSRTGADADVAALKVRVLRDVGDLGRALGAPRGEPDAVEDPEARDADGSIGAIDSDALVALARSTLAQGGEFARLLGLVPDVVPPLHLEAEVSAGPPGAPLSVAWAVPRAGSAQAWVGVIVDGATWTDGERERRARELDAAALRARVLRCGVPGELLWDAWSREHAQPGYRALWNEVMRAAWGYYAADLCVRVRPPANALARDGALSREVLRERHLAAVRCYVALRVHAEGASEAEAAREIGALTDLDGEAAAYEAREIRMDPLRGAAYVGYLELVRLETELAAGATEATDAEKAARWVAIAVRRAPSAPPRLPADAPSALRAATNAPREDR
jgi:hypothetical protein